MGKIEKKMGIHSPSLETGWFVRERTSASINNTGHPMQYADNQTLETH